MGRAEKGSGEHAVPSGGLFSELTRASARWGERRNTPRPLDGEKMARLCLEFGISRKTGYKMFDRYKDCGVHIGLQRPRPLEFLAATSAAVRQTDQEIAEAPGRGEQGCTSWRS